MASWSWPTFFICLLTVNLWLIQTQRVVEIPYFSSLSGRSRDTSLKQNFIAYRFSKVSYCIFEIHQLWQSGFCRVYSNCCCSCSFEPEIIKIGQLSDKVYSNNILNFQESTTILNAHTKKVWELIESTWYIYKNSSSSSSYRAGSTDIPDPLSPLLPIVHRPR